ncbi:MAG: cytochrome P460 family protein [Acidobacteriota bacterium]
MNHRNLCRLLAPALLTAGVVWFYSVKEPPATHAQGPERCDISFPLPNASDMGSAKYEKLLYAFLDKGCYKQWTADPQIRNTGPFIGGFSYGTHDAVKVFYSPEAWEWLKHRDRQGDVPDGAMIVKEMFPSPAREGLKLTGWTVMVKDKKGSYDGWYWSYHAPDYAPENPAIDYPDSGFGLYCLRCHASAEKESTFATVKNVEGSPISFNIEVPSMLPLPPPKEDMHSQIARKRSIDTRSFATARTAPDPAMLALFKGMPNPTAAQLKRFPGESFDHVVAGAGGPKGFLTSSQCMGCHSATNDDMVYPFGESNAKPINLSPYTEWRASMMGLAGRDPIFHAQLESEKTLYPARAEFFDNTCYRCHGVMGQRQVELDKNQPFTHQMVYALSGDPDAKYGALARDGISCAVCHQMSKEGLGTPAQFTGKFKLEDFNVVNGPYDQLVTLPMKQATGITPRFAEHVKSSALCGSCHTVILPVFDNQGKAVLDKNGKPKEFYEQTTYPEWLNSVYQNERAPVSTATVKTCQDCHMRRDFQGRQIISRIANIEDNNYPYTDFRLPDKEITVRIRDQFSRHTLIGINQFGLMMFQQFPAILGIRTADYMYGQGALGLETAQNSSDELAKKETAKIEVTSLNLNDKYLEAAVRVENLAGHSLPSGVAFRRAFLTFEVLDAEGKVIWASGRTNNVGAIVRGTSEEVLVTEFFFDPLTRKEVFQPHYALINDQGQVQIYEEVIEDPQGKITTSFTALDHPLKNNRLLPKGWRVDGPYSEHTGPHGDAERDPEYVNKSGASGADRIIYRVPLDESTRRAVSVRVTFNYQAIPPYYLKDRFTIGKGPETQRLAYLASHLTVAETPIENWKLRLVCATRKLEDSKSAACAQ